MDSNSIIDGMFKDDKAKADYYNSLKEKEKQSELESKIDDFFSDALVTSFKLGVQSHLVMTMHIC